MKILVFGWFSDKYSGEGIAQGFEECGCEVIRISTEACAPVKVIRESKKTGQKIIKDPGRFDLHIQDYYAKTHSRNKQGQMNEAYQLQLQNRRLKLKTNTDLYPDADWVFFIQNKFAWDFEGVQIPIYYYHTDIISTNLPIHAEKIHGFFYGYFGAADEMLNAYMYDYNHWVWKEFVPYGVNSKLFSPNKKWEDRTIKIGFMGSLAQNPHSKDERMAHIYDNRIEYLKFLTIQYPKDFVMKKFNEAKEYADFLGDCQVAVNIPGNWGKINQRQYEILAAGALLLQWNYPELKELGFINGINCLTFDCESQLYDTINWIHDHPKQASEIAKQGVIDFYNINEWDWKDRAHQFFTRITKSLSQAEMEREDWVIYETLKESNPQLEEDFHVQTMVIK